MEISLTQDLHEIFHKVILCLSVLFSSWYSIHCKSYFPNMEILCITDRFPSFPNTEIWKMWHWLCQFPKMKISKIQICFCHFPNRRSHGTQDWKCHFPNKERIVILQWIYYLPNLENQTTLFWIKQLSKLDFILILTWILQFFRFSRPGYICLPGLEFALTHRGYFLINQTWGNCTFSKLGFYLKTRKYPGENKVKASLDFWHFFQWYIYN